MFMQKVFESATNKEIWSLSTIMLVTCTMYMFWGYFQSVFLSLKLPGPPSVPILGNCLLIKERDLLKKRCATAYDLYGSLVRIWVLFFPFFVVLQPEDLQVVLCSKKHTNKAFFYKLMHNFLGNGLITSSGKKWSYHRKLIQPAFHLNMLEKFIGTFSDASQALCDNLDTTDLNEINISKYVNNCVIDILNEAVLGVPVKQKQTVDMEQSPFRQGKLVMPERFFQPWLLFDRIYQMTKLASEELQQKKRLDDFTRKMIKRRRELLAKVKIDSPDPNTDPSDENFQDVGDANRKCLLDYMIEISDNNTNFTEDDIVNEACTFMLAGQDSVGAAAAFTIFLLAQNQDCQQKCISELEHIFRDDKRSPTMSDLREMRYLEMCIKEALRLYPSVPLIARRLGEEISLGKYKLPSGSNIFICPYATHRLPHIYPDPEKFDPERFTAENCEKRHPYSYLPFSAGPRYCIGNRFAILEMKTMVSQLLRRYNIEPVLGKTSIDVIYRITIRASGGLWVRLRPRTK